MREIEHGASETARRYVFDDGVGEIGIIAPVSMPFCGHCSRVRLTSDGKLRTCLFSVIEHDLYGLMRRGASDERLSQFIIEADQPKRRAASHWRARICAALAQHGAHRRVRVISYVQGPAWRPAEPIPSNMEAVQAAFSTC